MAQLVGAVAILSIAGCLPIAIRADEPQPEDVIVARQTQMAEMQRLMLLIEAGTAGQTRDREALQSAALGIAQMMPAIPSLFPPGTNLYDPASTTPITLALPAIWQDFAEFSALNSTASNAATKLSALANEDELRAAALALRAACDACHTSFMRPYEPAKVSNEDLEFDFDALFEEDSADADEPTTRE